jgi:hypothetical protein
MANKKSKRSEAKNQAQFERTRQNKMRRIRRELEHNPNNTSARKRLTELERA